MAEQTATVPTLEYEGQTFRFPWDHEVPAPSEADRYNLKAGMEEMGFLTHKIVIDDAEPPNVIDGKHRLLFAKELGWPLGELPFETLRDLTYQQKAALARSLNYDRRQLPAEAVRARAEGRRERVQRKREEGKSTRQIAEEVGISQPQVRRDLKAGESPVSPAVSAHPEAAGPTQAPTANGTPAPETVTGKDGKQYPASRPKPPPEPVPEPPPTAEPDEEPEALEKAKRAAVLLAYEPGTSAREAARQVGLPESTLRGYLTGRKAELDAHVAAEPSRWPKDEAGQVIPWRLHKIFALREPLAEACQRCRDNTSLANRLLALPDFAGGTRFSQAGLADSKNAYQWFSRAAPFAVCPLCRGAGCQPPDPPDPIAGPRTWCNRSGWMTLDELRSWLRADGNQGHSDPCPDCKGRHCPACKGALRILKGA